MTKPTSAVLSVVLLLSSCATFGHSSKAPDARQVVAGDTLQCAAAAQRTTIAAALVSVGTSALATTLGSYDRTTGGQIGSVTLAVGSLVAALVSGVAFGHSVAYLDRAGKVLSGASADGCKPPAGD